MTNRSYALALAFSALLLSPAYGDERTRGFPEQRCKVSLPGEGWVWVEDKTGSALALAQNREGVVLSVSAVPAPQDFAVGNAFVKAFDREFFKGGAYVKRAGKVIKFPDVPCYQVLFRVADDKRMGALRVFIRDELCYHVQLIGEKQPIEKRRDFETIMHSFEFTAAASPKAK